MIRDDTLFKEVCSMDIRDIYDTFEFLGEGISRKVFAINKDFVLKIAKGSEGVYQNKVEYYVYTHCDERLQKYLCPILYFTSRRLIMPRAVPLYFTSKKDRKINLDEIRPEPYAFEEINELSKRFHLYYPDVIDKSSWGNFNGENILIDYGCTNEIGDLYYDMVFSLEKTITLNT